MMNQIASVPAQSWLAFETSLRRAASRGHRGAGQKACEAGKGVQGEHERVAKEDRTEIR